MLWDEQKSALEAKLARRDASNAQLSERLHQAQSASFTAEEVISSDVFEVGNGARPGFPAGNWDGSMVKNWDGWRGQGWI